MYHDKCLSVDGPKESSIKAIYLYSCVQPLVELSKPLQRSQRLSGGFVSTRSLSFRNFAALASLWSAHPWCSTYSLHVFSRGLFPPLYSGFAFDIWTGYCFGNLFLPVEQLEKPGPNSSSSCSGSCGRHGERSCLACRSLNLMLFLAHDVGGWHRKEVVVYTTSEG